VWYALGLPPSRSCAAVGRCRAPLLSPPIGPPASHPRLGRSLGLHTGGCATLLCPRWIHTPVPCPLAGWRTAPCRPLASGWTRNGLALPLPHPARCVCGCHPASGWLSTVVVGPGGTPAGRLWGDALGAPVFIGFWQPWIRPVLLAGPNYPPLFFFQITGISRNVYCLKNGLKRAF
jgi:hypothetical protein